MVSEKILVTGARGQLGTDLVTVLSRNFPVIGLDIDDFDLTNPQHVDEMFGIHKPKVVIHAAAFTDVDRCESEPDLAMRVNAEAAGLVARACRESEAHMIYYSTDYVFDGASRSPYLESDTPNPQTAYGRSKLEGEHRVAAEMDNHCILRLAWVFGAHGRNFVKTMVRLGRDQIAKRERGEAVSPIRVVNDQVGNPTWTMDIVRQTEALVARPLTGLYHCTSEGECSWYDFARAVFSGLSMAVEVHPCRTSEFPRPAPRPAYSSLENAALKLRGRNVMRPWRDALDEFLSIRKEELLHAV